MRQLPLRRQIRAVPSEQKARPKQGDLDCGESEFRLAADAIAAGLAAKMPVYEIAQSPKGVAIASQKTVYRWMPMRVATSGNVDLPMVATMNRLSAKSHALLLY